jgi:hypothetical protein
MSIWAPSATKKFLEKLLTLPPRVSIKEVLEDEAEFFIKERIDCLGNSKLLSSCQRNLGRASF